MDVLTYNVVKNDNYHASLTRQEIIKELWTTEVVIATYIQVRLNQLGQNYLIHPPAVVYKKITRIKGHMEIMIALIAFLKCPCVKWKDPTQVLAAICLFQLKLSQNN